jgi:hypothetical protein
LSSSTSRISSVVEVCTARHPSGRLRAVRRA